ncbi:unnamed protein product [Parascedosporium putredinis]|uniref:Uncharacterized protein n=1 Tax=Parascedosporium putredinis TaxID=1442378 RepID=A0A9P1GYI2_9PEZI|nr:unnamed protein product [Parascedosporium putredinis]CAI7990158.1 unnamed protein product [Parascedosporium putredinis]
MVLGVLTAIAACPAIVGTNEAIQMTQKNQMKQMHRERKTNLVVSCTHQDNKLWIATRRQTANDDAPEGHQFAGYFFKHPTLNWGRKGDGYVSTIMDDPPMLNWIYVDKDTYEVKYGTKSESEDHRLGPFSCTPVDHRLTFDEWEGFCAVEERPGIWSLYFDVDDDGLEEKVSMDKDVLEIELIRREMRIPHSKPKDVGPEE